MRFSLFILCFSLFLGSPAFGVRKVTIACIDCYSSASLYPHFAQNLAPDVQVKWIPIQTHDYDPMFQASLLAFDTPARRWDPSDENQTRELIADLKAQDAFVLGGMDEGAYHSCLLNEALGKPDNTLAGREARRRKQEMAHAVDARWRIPTLLTDSVDAAMEFAQTFPQPSVAMKPNAGAAGIGFEHFPKADKSLLRGFIQSRLETEVRIFGERDDWVIQPYLEGDKFYANTFTKDGETRITGLWRYHMSEEGGLGFFVDRPLSLTSEVARELSPIASAVNVSLGVVHGSSHIEFLRDRATGRWYLLENNARTAGAGIPALETRIWGISQLELTLLAILDPERFRREFDAFPRRKQRDGFLLILPSAGKGMLTESGIARLLSLPGAFVPAPHYQPRSKAVKKSFNLQTVAGVFHFAEEPGAVRSSFDQVLSFIQQEKVIDYATTQPCASLLERRAFVARLERVASGIDWNHNP